jgi:hypothetical protein
MKKSYKDNLFRFKCPRKNTQRAVCVFVCSESFLSLSLSSPRSLFIYLKQLKLLPQVLHGWKTKTTHKRSGMKTTEKESGTEEEEM